MNQISRHSCPRNIRQLELYPKSMSFSIILRKEKNLVFNLSTSSNIFPKICLNQRLGTNEVELVRKTAPVGLRIMLVAFGFSFGHFRFLVQQAPFECSHKHLFSLVHCLNFKVVSIDTCQNKLFK
jgi:citrate lyase synthetase